MRKKSLQNLNRAKVFERAGNDAFASYAPPSNLTVSDWADTHRILSPENSAESGKWHTRRTPYLKEIMDAFTDFRVSNIAVVAPAQVGKALACDTLLPTPDGYVAMGDVMVGDSLFDERGNQCKVTFATDIMYDHPCYQVSFDDGTSIVADADHRWGVINSVSNMYEVVTTKHMAIKCHDLRRYSLYSIPITGPLKLPQGSRLWGHERDCGSTLAWEQERGIPTYVLRSSFEQRVKVLQAIMDESGTMDSGWRCYFSAITERFACDFGDLLSGLGIKFQTMLRPCAKGDDKIRFSFYAPAHLLVFGLAHLQQRQKSRGKLRTIRRQRRYVIDVSRVKSMPVRCIQVDSSSHLFLAGRGMIPTHNTEVMLNDMARAIVEDPGPMLYIMPTTTTAETFSKRRVAPMIRDTQVLRKRVSEAKSRNKGNTILNKNFPGGMLSIIGSNSAPTLASTPVRYVFGDEIDRWAASAGTEGDPMALAKARTDTFYNAKMIWVSTPTIKGASRIEDEYNIGTRERWCSECPHCGAYHEIKWGNNIRFDYDRVKDVGKIDFTVKSVVWVCPSCGAVSDEKEMKRQSAKWIADNPDAYEQGSRSFWLNAFVSPWKSWESIILDFLQAGKDPAKLQVVFNTKFGELWEMRGDIESEDDMMVRREVYDAQVPDGVLVLTCGVDTQDDRLEYEVVGHGHFKETWGITRGVIIGKPDDAETWQMLDDVLETEYLRADGKTLSIRATCIDSGGHYTQDVYQQCARRHSRRVFAIKGIGGDDKQFVNQPKKVNIVKRRRHVGQCWLYTIGVDSGKQQIMSSLKVQEAGARYCHFPENEEYGYEFFQGLLSEHLVYKRRSGKDVWVWEKNTPGIRNEPLDCRNYALAAFRILNPNLAAAESRLREEVKNEPKPKPRPKRKPKRKKDIYDRVL